jgi:hypothetical protein
MTHNFNQLKKCKFIYFSRLFRVYARHQLRIPSIYRYT